MGSINGTRTRRADNRSIYKRKDGRWVAAVIVGYDGKGNPIRKSKYAPTRAEAVQLAEKMVEAKNKNQLVLTRDQTLEAFAGHWLNEIVRAEKAPKTFHFYRANLEQHILPILGRKKLTEIRPVDIQSLIAKLAREKGLRVSTLRGVRATLSSALNYAYRMDLVASIATEKVSLPREQTIERKFLNPEQARALHTVAKDDPAGPVIAFGLLTGARIGEVLGLQWKDVDQGGGRILLSKQLQRVDGTVSYRQLKSFSSRRSIPITSEIQIILNEQEKRFLALTGRNPFPDEPLFTTSKGTAWDARNVNRSLYLLCEKAGVPKVSFHCLRHTVATLSMAGGSDLFAVKSLLGHSQISLTADLYAHAQMESNRTAMNSVASFLIPQIKALPE